MQKFMDELARSKRKARKITLSDVEERSCTEVTHDTHKHMLLTAQEQKKKKRSGERAQWTKVIAAKAEGLGSFPGTDMVEGENRLPRS